MNNYSRQREIILETLKEVNIHPTAEELYKLVNRKYPKISKSTVYRNINILVESNVIRKIKMLSGADRFDYICKEHYHAICEKCGSVFDFMYNFKKDELEKVVQNQTGVIPKANSITIYGTCNKCKKIRRIKNGIKREQNRKKFNGGICRRISSKK